MNNLEEIFFHKAKELDCREALFETTIKQLKKMKNHHPATYYHELRVALIAARIAEFSGHKDVKPEFFGGANHDTGKLGVAMSEFDEREVTDREFKKIKSHTKGGHRALREYLFTSMIAGAHHRHQKNSYGIDPEKILKKSTMSNTNKERLKEAILNVSLADYYDACSTRSTKPIERGDRCQNIEENYPNQAEKINFLKNDEFVKIILDSH